MSYLSNYTALVKRNHSVTKRSTYGRTFKKFLRKFNRFRTSSRIFINNVHRKIDNSFNDLFAIPFFSFRSWFISDSIKISIDSIEVLLDSIEVLLDLIKGLLDLIKGLLDLIKVLLDSIKVLLDSIYWNLIRFNQS